MFNRVFGWILAAVLVFAILTAVISGAFAQTKMPVSAIAATGTPSATTFLRGDGTWAAVSGSGGGTVSSVGLSAPSIFSVTGSPVTESGTLTLSIATEPANYFWAGPASGSAAAAGFRSIAPADLPLGTGLVVTGGVVSATPESVGAVSTTGGSTVTASGPGVAPLILQGAAGQTADLFDVQSSGGSDLFSISSAGVTTFYGATAVFGGALNITYGLGLSGADEGTDDSSASAAESLSTDTGYETYSAGGIVPQYAFHDRIAAGEAVQWDVSGGGGMQASGYCTIAALSTPAIASVTAHGTAGSTSYYYKVTAQSGAGTTAASSEVSISTGNATLSSTNYNVVTIAPLAGAESYSVYRGTAPGGEALIASGLTSAVYDDMGGTASGALPAANTTGYVKAALGRFGNIASALRSVSASTDSASPADCFITFYATCTETLPAASLWGGETITLADTSSSYTITVSNSIMGSPSTTLSTIGAAETFFSDGVYIWLRSVN